MTRQELESTLLQVFNKHIDNCHIILINNINYNVSFRILGYMNDMKKLEILLKKDNYLKNILNPKQDEVIENTKSFGYLDCNIKTKTPQLFWESLGYLKMYFC